MNYCETCEWCEPEYIKADGTEDKRYKAHKWCGLHQRSTKRKGYCHWWMERFSEENDQ